MKQQFQNSREELISHIQTKLSRLKQQRDNMLNESIKPEDTEKVKISNYLQAQKGERVQNLPERRVKPTIRPIIEQQASVALQSKAEMIESRLNAKQKCEMLKELYEKKRELEKVGIIEVNPDKIKKLYQNKAIVNKIQKDLIKNKKKEQQRQQKQKIIQQELLKAQSFLKQAKKSSKVKSFHSQYAYSELLKGQQQKINQFQQLLNKNKLTLVQKELLLEMTFNILKQFPQRVSKSFLEGFLLANDQFCRIFFLTKEEIMRDLKVHTTEENGFLSYREFYEFIKSVQITNKAIKPNLKYANKTTKTVTGTKVKSKQQTIRSNNWKEVEQYLKKVFLYLDQKRQRIVQRQRIEIAFSKGLLFDEKKIKSVTKDSICKFGVFIKSKRQEVGNKSYYKSLDSKYIGMEELFELYKLYMKSFQDHIQNKSSSEIKSIEKIPTEQDEQIQFSQAILTNLVEAEIPDSRTDFQKYGWGENRNDNEEFSQLSQLDKYYKEMSNKHGNQIHWNNYKVYQQDFRKFNQCISQMKENHQETKEIVGLNFPPPVQEQQFEESSQSFQ